MGWIAKLNKGSLNRADEMESTGDPKKMAKAEKIRKGVADSMGAGPKHKVVVRHYKNTQEFEDEAEIYIRLGYSIKGETATDGHVNVGRTLLPALMTGGLSLFFGASRTKGVQTVTYVRD